MWGFPGRGKPGMCPRRAPISLCTEPGWAGAVTIENKIPAGEKLPRIKELLCGPWGLCLSEGSLPTVSRSANTSVTANVFVHVHTCVCV